MSVYTKIKIKSNGAAFVNDSALGETLTYVLDPNLSQDENMATKIHHVIENLRQKSQHWERLLFSTGGALNLYKSHWYLLAWNWKQGKSSLITQTSNPLDLLLTSGNTSTPSPIPRLNPNSSFKTLRMHISPSGSQSAQFKVLCSHSDQYYSSLLPPIWPQTKPFGPTYYTCDLVLHTL
jgi:hypothetical protein